MNGHQSSQMLVDSVEKLLVDRSFGPPSEITVACRSTGERLSQWLAAAENQEKARAFSDTLFFSLDDCFNQRGTDRIRKETMWGKFHQVRCSEPFTRLWRTFLMETLGVEACPTLFQYLTDDFFRAMIRCHFPLRIQENQSCPEQKLSYNEKNALRYAAGYVMRHLKKVKRSAHPLKDELEFCLTELTETNREQDDESEDWVMAIDRGGLKHISNMTYMMFEAMELEFRSHFVVSDVQQSSQMKCKVKSEIESNEDVLFYWCMLCAEWEVDTANVLYT